MVQNGLVRELCLQVIIGLLNQLVLCWHLAFKSCRRTQMENVQSKINVATKEMSKVIRSVLWSVTPSVPARPSHWVVSLDSGARCSHLSCWVTSLVGTRMNLCQKNGTRFLHLPRHSHTTHNWINHVYVLILMDNTVFVIVIVLVIFDSCCSVPARVRGCDDFRSMNIWIQWPYSIRFLWGRASSKRSP